MGTIYLWRFNERTSMLCQKLFATCSILIFGAIGFSGCEFIGPIDIKNGRPNYNDAIQTTSKQQVFLNIVLVANHEPPFFMDISEVDASLQASGSIMGGPAGIGSRGATASTTGSITGTLSYQESPTIRYQPLQGQPLIAQISSPITPDSIQSLIDSRWPISAVLLLATDRLTPNAKDYAVAIDSIGQLDSMGAIVVSAEPSQNLIQAPLIASYSSGKSDSDDGSNKERNKKKGKKKKDSGTTTRPSIAPESAVGIMGLSPLAPYSTLGLGGGSGGGSSGGGGGGGGGSAGGSGSGAGRRRGDVLPR